MAPTKTFFDIVNELAMKSNKKLPNLKEPVKGKKGTSKFMRMKIHNAPYTSDYKKAMNASVDSADRKPEKYMKPDGKMGIRMVKTKKEIISKESSFGDNSFAARLIKIRNHPKVKAARKAHAAGTWDGNVDKEGEAVVHINGKPHTVTNKYSKKKTNEAKTFNYFDSKDAAHAHAKKHGGKVFVNTGKGATQGKNTHVVIKKEEVEVDEALNLAQRMKRSRLMKRMKSRIKIGKQRAMRKMANKKTLEKRSMRQARNAIAKKLTRGIPKKELTFARKKEIEKRLEKPALQQRIKRLAKRMFKDVRKKEVERKKG
tara:strand:+ start:2432 stop:3373 length:942 start_codon:yes stop_codon:yes gene_type:complete